MHKYILGGFFCFSLILGGSVFAETTDSSMIQQNQTQDIQKMERDRMNADPATGSSYSPSNTTNSNQINSQQLNKNISVPVPADPNVPSRGVIQTTPPVNSPPASTTHN